MKELKEKTFTEDCENAQEERERNEKYNPNRELDDAAWMKYVNIR